MLQLHKWLATDGRTTVRVIDECCAGWLDESWDIFGVGNRHSRARARRGCPELFRIGSPLRRAMKRMKKGRPEIECVGDGVGAGRYRVEGGATKGKGEAETICPHMLCPAYVEPQAVRENRSSETRNRLSVRREEVGNVTFPEMSKETSVFVIRKCSRKEN